MKLAKKKANKLMANIFLIFFISLLLTPGVCLSEQLYWVQIGAQHRDLSEVKHYLDSTKIAANELNICKTENEQYIIVANRSEKKQSDAETWKLYLKDDLKITDSLSITKVGENRCLNIHALLPMGLMTKLKSPEMLKQTKGKISSPNPAAVSNASLAQISVGKGPAKEKIVEIMPEVQATVFLSSKHNNRIYCESGDPIKDVVTSKELGIDVNIHGNSAFIKYLAEKDTTNGKIYYNERPAEFYVICGESTIYTFIGLPRQIYPVTIKMRSVGDKAGKNMAYFKAMPFEQKVADLIKMAITGEYKESFDIEHVFGFQKLKLEPGIELNIDQKLRVQISGENLILKEYDAWIDVSALTQNQDFEPPYSKLLEKELFSESPVALCLFPKKMKAGAKSRLFVVERR